MILALVLALLSGALCAVLVCKAIHLRLWLDVAAGLGGGLSILLAARLAGAESWPLLGWPVGFVAVVAWLKIRKART